MSYTKNISFKGLEIIKSFENYSAKIYICPAGLRTIGFGHVLNNNENISQLTYSQAEELLLQDLKPYEYILNYYNKTSLTQNQFDALISFSFNIGRRAFLTSRLFKYLQVKKFFQAANQFSRWIYCKGRILKGLVSRRQKEKELFVTELIKKL